MRAVRPDVVFCRASGFASDSPRAEEPAYDDVVQAASGLCDTYRLRSGTPELAPYLIADKVAGLTIVWSVLAALYHRAMTGDGQLVEVPMVDAVSAFTLVEHGSAAIAHPPQGAAGYGRTLTPERRPRRTRDGWIVIVPYTRANYEAIFRVGGRSDLLDDARISTPHQLNMNADSLYAEVAEIVTHRTTAEWLEVCAREQIPASALRTIDEMVDELALVEHPAVGRYRLIPVPARFSRTPCGLRSHAGAVGEHTDAALRRAGFSDEEIGGLRASGAVPR